MHKKVHKWLKTGTAFICCAVLISGAVQIVVPNPAMAYADVDALQEQIDALEKKNSEVREQLDDLEDDIEAKEAELKLLEQQKANAQEQVVLYSQKLSILKENITKNELDIADKEVSIEEHTELFGQRVRAMYMSSYTSTLELLFNSTSFSEFLSQVETLRRISEFDNNLIATLKQEKEDLKILREDLLKQQAEHELTYQQYVDTAAQLEFDIEEVELSQAELEKVKAEYQANIDENEAAAAKLEAETAALIKKYAEEERKRKEEEERRRREEEEKKKQSSQSSDSSSSTQTEHNFTWPLPSSATITSYFGPRVVFGANDNHGAVDIAAPKESAIVASKSGTVIAAGESGTTYGIYVIISHGDGYSTLYAHCNSVDVSVGDYVTQGQRIAGVGTTGRSSGYHLHFEVRKNGVRVDPLDYVSKPW